MKRISWKTVAILLSALVAFGVVACDGAAGANGKDSVIRKSNGAYYLHRYVTQYDQNGEPEKTVTFGTANDFETAAGDFVTVEKISAGAFAGNKTIENLVIADGVKEIGEGAFKGMTALKSLTVPFIGKSADENVNRSEKAILAYFFGDEEFDGSIEVKQNYAEEGKTDYDVTCYLPASLHTITVKNNTTEGYRLSDFAFYGAFLVSEIKLEGNVTAIGDYAFARTGIQSFTVPDAVSEIGDHAFYGNTTLTELSFGASATLAKIGDYAFAGTKCQRLVLPATVETLGEGAFSSVLNGEESLVKSVSMTGVKTIGKYAFYGCEALEDVTLGSDLEKIYAGAFMNCKKLATLTGVTLEDSVITAANKAEVAAFKGTAIDFN